MDDNDDILNSPEIMAEFNVLEELVEAEPPPTLARRLRFPALMLLILIFLPKGLLSLGALLGRRLKAFSQ